MILVDISQIMNMNVHSLMSRNQFTPENFKHNILNSLRKWNAYFRKEYGEFVICCDGKNSWRGDDFQYYKQKRKDTRKKSTIDWNWVYEIFGEILEDIKENFQYKVIKLPRVEADDIIGVLCINKEHKYSKERILILSGDKDFGFLQANKNVSQFCPKKKKYLNVDDPENYLIDLILSGDSSDGIPNVLSEDDILIRDKARQTSLREDKKEEIKKWISVGKFECDKIRRNFDRNRRMIDLREIPDEIQDNILKEFEKVPKGTPRTVFNYLMNNRMGALLKSVLILCQR